MLQGSTERANNMNDGGPQFAEVFVIYWVGALIVTLNIKLLGGSMWVCSRFVSKSIFSQKFSRAWSSTESWSAADRRSNGSRSAICERDKVSANSIWPRWVFREVTFSGCGNSRRVTLSSPRKSFPLHAPNGVGHPEVFRRITFSALANSSRSQWKVTFEEVSFNACANTCRRSWSSITSSTVLEVMQVIHLHYSKIWSRVIHEALSLIRCFGARMKSSTSKCMKSRIFHMLYRKSAELTNS